MQVQKSPKRVPRFTSKTNHRAHSPSDALPLLRSQKSRQRMNTKVMADIALPRVKSHRHIHQLLFHQEPLRSLNLSFPSTPFYVPSLHHKTSPATPLRPWSTDASSWASLVTRTSHRTRRGLHSHDGACEADLQTRQMKMAQAHLAPLRRPSTCVSRPCHMGSLNPVSCHLEAGLLLSWPWQRPLSTAQLSVSMARLVLSLQQRASPVLLLL